MNTNIEAKKAEWYAHGHLVMARAEDGSVIQIAALSSSVDAKIVAASKDLLKAIKMVNEYYEESEDCDQFGEMVSGSIDIIFAAINKATI